MKVLVTGAHGFIGSHLVDGLLRADMNVRALVSPWGTLQNLRDAQTSYPNRLELVRADITDPESLRSVCDGVDVVYHAAARVAEYGPAAPFFEVNVQGTKNLLRAAERARVRRLVLVSSVAVSRYTGYRDADPRSLALDGDINAYARSKAAAERLVMAAGGLEPVAVRPGLNPYGSRDPNFARQLGALRWGLPPLVAGGRAVFNPVFAENLVAGLILAGTVPAAAGRVYLIADAGTPSWREWFMALAALNGTPKPWLNLPGGVATALGGAVETVYERLAPRAQPPLSRYLPYVVRNDVHFSLAAAQLELGYTPEVSWQDGLARTLQAHKRAVT